MDETEEQAKEGKTMYKISYDPLWKTLVDKHWNKVDLQKATKLSSATIAKLTNGESVTMDVIGRICETLECPVYDVVEIRLKEFT